VSKLKEKKPQEATVMEKLFIKLSEKLLDYGKEVAQRVEDIEKKIGSGNFIGGSSVKSEELEIMEEQIKG
jgi:hypothetical protein